MYYRYADEYNKINEMTGFGMFAKNERRVSNCYGENKYVYDGKNSVNIEKLKDRFIEAWEECSDCAPDYMQGLTGEEFFDCFNPDDIVEDAGAWDNDDFRRFFIEHIYNDEAAIILNDGAIVFDENLIEEA